MSNMFDWEIIINFYFCILHVTSTCFVTQGSFKSINGKSNTLFHFRNVLHTKVRQKPNFICDNETLQK